MRNVIAIGWIALICLGSAPSHAQVWLNLGYSNISVNIDNPAVDGQSSGGLNLGIKQYFNDDWSYEVSLTAGRIDVGPASDIFYPADTASLGLVYLGIQKDFKFSQDNGLRGWLGAGYSIQIINWDTYVYDISGSGFALSAGLLQLLDKNWRINGGYRYHSFDGETSSDTDADGNSAEWFINIQYNISSLF